MYQTLLDHNQYNHKHFCGFFFHFNLAQLTRCQLGRKCEVGDLYWIKTELPKWQRAPNFELFPSATRRGEEIEPEVENAMTSHYRYGPCVQLVHLPATSTSTINNNTTCWPVPHRRPVCTTGPQVGPSTALQPQVDDSQFDTRLWMWYMCWRHLPVTKQWLGCYFS